MLPALVSAKPELRVVLPSTTSEVSGAGSCKLLLLVTALSAAEDAGAGAVAVAGAGVLVVCSPNIDISLVSTPFAVLLLSTPKGGNIPENWVPERERGRTIGILPDAECNPNLLLLMLAVGSSPVLRDNEETISRIKLTRLCRFVVEGTRLLSCPLLLASALALALGLFSLL